MGSGLRSSDGLSAGFTSVSASAFGASSPFQGGASEWAPLCSPLYHEEQLRRRQTSAGSRRFRGVQRGGGFRLKTAPDVSPRPPLVLHHVVLLLLLFQMTTGRRSTSGWLSSTSVTNMERRSRRRRSQEAQSPRPPLQTLPPSRPPWASPRLLLTFLLEVVWLPLPRPALRPSAF